MSTDSSAFVSRSTSSVANRWALRYSATARLRLLKRLLPLPCANITSPPASGGMFRSAPMCPASTGISNDCVATALRMGPPARSVVGLQQRADLFISGLRKIAIPHADGRKLLRRSRAYRLVGDVGKFSARRGSSDRNRDDDARGLVLSNR